MDEKQREKLKQNMHILTKLEIQVEDKKIFQRIFKILQQLFEKSFIESSQILANEEDNSLRNS